MRHKHLWLATSLLVMFSMLLSACGGSPTPAPPAVEPTQPPAQQPEPTTPVQPTEPAQPPEQPTEPVAQPEPEEFVIGMLLVGPFNDRGWSQAHHEAGEYVEDKLPGTSLVYIDKVNPADRPGTTGEQLAESLVAQGAQLIIFNSDDMKDDALNFARNNPEIYVIHASGDAAWEEGEDYKGVPNLANVMGIMEYGKEIAGCLAAMTTDTGKIGYLGPLINEETRRLVASTYLGARYCWENYRGNDPADLEFRVTWIGFWFNIPGFTSDPTQVANEFYNSGYDVVISGIDTTEALVEAGKQTAAGRQVWAIPYDYVGACEEAPDVCLGVPYFNWGPSYLEHVQEIQAGTWEPTWEWLGPNWDDINDHDTSMIGFMFGPGASPEAAAQVEQFIDELAGGLRLWTGPLNLQDGTPYLAEGEVATDHQIWYLPQLLEGMLGQSVAD
jgi:simple sugar transport system substrate-binding protein